MPAQFTTSPVPSQKTFAGAPREVIEYIPIESEEDIRYWVWEKYEKYTEESEVFDKLEWVATHQNLVAVWKSSYEDDMRCYSLLLSDAFQLAIKKYPSIFVDSRIMGGAPCIKGTRIPVYMVLDAVEYHGSLEGAMKSYPSLTMEQVKDALGFSKLVVECPLDDETEASFR